MACLSCRSDFNETTAGTAGLASRMPRDAATHHQDEKINLWPLNSPDKITENPRFSQPREGHYCGVTNPVLQDAARIELVPPERRETPALELVLSLARREVLLAPNELARMRALQHEAELISGLSAAFAGRPLSNRTDR